MRRPVKLILMLAVALLAPACDTASPPPPATTCTKVAEQCKLPDGRLGICNTTPCKQGEAFPCLRCTSQH